MYRNLIFLHTFHGTCLGSATIQELEICVSHRVKRIEKYFLQSFQWESEKYFRRGIIINKKKIGGSNAYRYLRVRIINRGILSTLVLG